MQADHTAEFKVTTQKFAHMLTEAVSTVNGGVELRKPEPPLSEQYDLKPASLNAAIADEEVRAAHALPPEMGGGSRQGAAASRSAPAQQQRRQGRGLTRRCRRGAAAMRR